MCIITKTDGIPIYSMWYNIDQIYLHYCKFQISLLNVQWACNIFIALILEFIYIEPVMTSVCRQNELSCPANQSNLWLRHFIGHFTSTTASFPKIIYFDCPRTNDKALKETLRAQARQTSVWYYIKRKKISLSLQRPIYKTP